MPYRTIEPDDMSAALIEKLTVRIAELERRNAMLTKEFDNFIGAVNDAEGDYAIGLAISKAEEILSATPADAEAWLQADRLKWLGEPVAHALKHDLEILHTYKNGCSCVLATRPSARSVALYRLPEPLATPEERIKEGRI